MADQYSMKRDKKVIIIICILFANAPKTLGISKKKKHYEYMLTKYNAQRG